MGAYTRPLIPSLLSLAISVSVGCSITPGSVLRSGNDVPLTCIAHDPPDQRHVAHADGWYNRKKAAISKIIRSKQGWKKQLKDVENLIDDPVDDLKHKVHGMKMLGYRVYLPKFLMSGKDDPCRGGRTSAKLTTARAIDPFHPAPVSYD
jgi:hypothetical protein